MTAAPSPLGEVARLFTRLGFTAFGGPAAHVAMMHDEVVTRRGWLDRQRFVDLMGATSLIPGPNSTEMSMHLGHVRAGWRGLIVGGVCFITPAAVIVLALAWAYVRYGDTPAGEALLYGIEPVVVAIIVQALVLLARTAVRGVDAVAIALLAAALYLLGGNELVVLFGGAVVVLVLRTGVAGATASVVALLPVMAGDAAEPARTLGLARLFGVFLKVGALLYGSGYVLLAFLRGDLVQRLGVLSDEQLLDAVAIGQFTPGPVFTTATFIGYLLGGLAGAAVATVAIFLPGFLFVAALTRILPRIRDRAWTSALLDGVNAAALGLMGGVVVQLAGEALVDPLTVAVLLVTGVLLWRTELNSAWLVAGGGAVGLLAGAGGMVS